MDGHDVAQDMRQRIEQGEFKAGDPVGTIDQAMVRYKVTRGVARVGFQMLVRDGWLVTQPRQGHFVASVIPPKGEPRTRQTADRLAALEERVDRLERRADISDD